MGLIPSTQKKVNKLLTNMLSAKGAAQLGMQFGNNACYSHLAKLIPHTRE